MSRTRLEELPLFSELDAGEVELVAPYFQTVTVEAGRHCVIEGETGDDMFILIDGRARVSKSMILAGLSVPLLETDDPRKTLATVGPEDRPVFGEMALLDRDVRSATVTALTDCVFLRIDRRGFFDLVAAHPRIGARLLAALGRRLASVIRRNNTEIVKLTTALALLISRRK